jgi:3'(2'), 5'-bisphosphate nucleotidase
MYYGHMELLTLAEKAALEAGQHILSLYGSTTFALKSDNSPVTQADHDANNILVQHLTATNIPILSEELPGISHPYPDTLWVIDPLDGTKGFINTTDDFSVMIALLHEGHPVLSVVYAPAHHTCYVAERNNGAFVKRDHITTRLRVSSRAHEDLIMIKSVNHEQPYMNATAETLSVKHTTAIGSVGIKAGYIGEERGDFYLNRGHLGEWDVCAPQLLVEEAGGTVTDTHGNALTYGAPNHRIAHGVIFSNNTSHEHIVCALSKN